jgi:hypothetical protein
MAISDFASLQTAMTSWASRSDLTALYPDFITLGEAKINRRLRIRAMETALSLTTVAGTATVALPTRYVQMKSIYINADPKVKLQPVSLEQGITMRPSSGTGEPHFFATEADNIRFFPTPDAAYSIAGIYYASFAGLTATNTANALLTSSPDLYLASSMYELAKYVRDDARMSFWAAQREDAFKDIEQQDDRDRFSGGALLIRTDTLNP